MSHASDQFEIDYPAFVPALKQAIREANQKNDSQGLVARVQEVSGLPRGKVQRLFRECQGYREIHDRLFLELSKEPGWKDYGQALDS